MEDMEHGRYLYMGDIVHARYGIWAKRNMGDMVQWRYGTWKNWYMEIWYMGDMILVRYCTWEV